MNQYVKCLLASKWHHTSRKSTSSSSTNEDKGVAELASNSMGCIGNIPLPRVQDFVFGWKPVVGTLYYYLDWLAGAK